MHLQGNVMQNGQLFVKDKKENCVKRFEIVLDKPADHRYIPGQEISGAVELHVRQPLEICFMEFTVCGYAIACAVHPQQGLSFSKRETYIKKRVIILGSADGLTSTIIVPGRYNSKFNFKLPPNLPSTNIYEDKKGCLLFQVRYFIQARLCDDIISSMRGISKRQTVIKVFMSRLQDIIVQRPFDISAVHMAMWPVSHNEEIVLGCGPFDTEKSSITATLDHSMYCAGDKITVKLDTNILHAKHFKSLRCELRQRVKLRRTSEVMNFVTESITVRDPTWRIERLESERPTASVKIALMTARNILPSVLEGCNLLHVTYTVRVTVRMVNHAAIMVFEVPLSIAPAKHVIIPNNDSTEMKVPIFNRPMRFPRFTDSHHATFSPDSSGESSNPGSNRSSENLDTTTTSSPSRKTVTVSVHV